MAGRLFQLFRMYYPPVSLSFFLTSSFSSHPGPPVSAGGSCGDLQAPLAFGPDRRPAQNTSFFGVVFEPPNSWKNDQLAMWLPSAMQPLAGGGGRFADCWSKVLRPTPETGHIKYAVPFLTQTLSHLGSVYCTVFSTDTLNSMLVMCGLSFTNAVKISTHCL